MGGKLTAMSNDTASQTYIVLTPAVDNVGGHLVRVVKTTNRDATLLLIAQAGNAALDGGKVWAALDVEGGVAMLRKAIEKTRRGDLVEEGAKSSRRPDCDKAAAARLSFESIDRRINPLAFQLTSL
jgi:hypothetical protein